MHEDFLFHLRDTLVLLGADRRVVEMVGNPLAVTAKDVDELKRYNGQLVDATKSKLADLNRLTVQPRQP